MQRPNMNSRFHNWLRWCFLAVGCCALWGCQSKSAFEFDQMDMLLGEEDLAEFPLGEYRIPIPLVDNRAAGPVVRTNRLELDFHLYALVSPKEEAEMEEAWNRHEGVIRDQVISICRRATVEELQEPELVTLKARLTDVLAAQLGEKRLRQLLIADVVSQQL